jgi:Helix-turn-helix domain
MAYTLREAARATGKSKPAISKAIKSGRLSGSRADDGSYRIDPAELERVYPVTGNYPFDKGNTTCSMRW